MVMLFGLAAAALYGTGDFLGGLASRKVPVLAVLLLAQTAGVIVALPAAAMWPGPASLAGLAWGISAGLIGGVGVIIFYRGLAAGPMSVVAPVSGVVSTVLPVAVALAEGERPGTGVYTGALLCLALLVPRLAGTVLSASTKTIPPSDGPRPPHRTDLEPVDEGLKDRVVFALFRQDRPRDQVDKDAETVEDRKDAEPEPDQVDVDPEVSGKSGAHSGDHPAVPKPQQPFAPAAVVLTHISDDAQTRYALSSGFSPPLP